MKENISNIPKKSLDWNRKNWIKSSILNCFFILSVQISAAWLSYEKWYVSIFTESVNFYFLLKQAQYKSIKIKLFVYYAFLTFSTQNFLCEYTCQAFFFNYFEDHSKSFRRLKLNFIITEHFDKISLK